MSSRCGPGWRVVSLAGVIVDLDGEVGDQLGSLAVRRSRPLAAVTMWRSGCAHQFQPRGGAGGLAGRPGGFIGDSGDVLVGAVELCDGLGSDELFGCNVEAVGVALDRLEEPGRWVVELAQQAAGGDGRFIAGMICCSASVGVRGEMVSGRMRVWGSPSQTTRR